MPTTMVATMIIAFALSISVAVAIGLASLVGAWQADLNFLAVVKEMFSAINKFPLAAIPFFILAGNLMESGGISARLVDFAKSIVGGIQGGLGATCVLTCMIFAAVSGSSWTACRRSISQDTMTAASTGAWPKATARSSASTVPACRSCWSALFSASTTAASA